MKSKWKKILLLLGITFLAWGMKEARADGPYTTDHALVIKVSIANAAKSFSVNKSTWDFSAMNTDATSVSTAPIVVTNDSGGITQTYRLAVNSISPNTWTLGAAWNTTANNEYVLGAQFGTNQSANSDGAWGSDILTASPVSASTTQFGNGSAGESGASVPNTGVRNLWFRIETPATTDDATQHSIYVMLSME